MHDGSLVLAQPRHSDRLLLLFHGVGSSARDLAPLGSALAQARPAATVVSVEAPLPSQLGQGQEWLSVGGITEGNRPQRIAGAMPSFLQAIRHWQDRCGLGPQQTVLLGFSQGAIMALESTQLDAGESGAAHRVMALAGRFAGPVRRAPSDLRLNLIHGEQDDVVWPKWSAQAAAEWSGLGGDVTLDLVPGLGHGIDARALQLALKHLPPG
ncbi:MAG: esterase [Rhodoferax sp.]|nr:esterase [Rhodoferax sp.]